MPKLVGKLWHGMPGAIKKLERIPFALWIAVALLLLTWRIWHLEYIADDLPFLRAYMAAFADDGYGFRVLWGRVAEDLHGPWHGNPHYSFYRPAVSASLALDLSIFGAVPAVHAYGNLLLHFLAALCLYWVAKLTLPDKRCAALAACLFALSPLAHENIAWAVGRGNLTLVFGLCSGLVFLRAHIAGLRAVRLHACSLTLLLLNLCTLESAVVWAFWPVTCVLLLHCFKSELRRPSIKQLGHMLLPPMLLVGMYLLFRSFVLGSISGDLDPLSGDPWLYIARYSERLLTSLRPWDASFVPSGMPRTAYTLICIVPICLGLFAHLCVKGERSRVYRRALFVLLSFWLLSNLPSLRLPLRDNLGESRHAYYSFPSLALCMGLLLASSRPARFAAWLICLCFALGLTHRIGERVHQAELGRTARHLLYEEARTRGAIAPARDSTESSRPVLCYVNQVNGIWGAPVYQKGEMAYALYPPLLPQRVRALSLHEFIAPDPQSAKEPELAAAAVFAQACGGMVRTIPSGDGVKLERIPQDTFLQKLPALAFEASFERRQGQAYPELVLPKTWRQDPGLEGARAWLFLVCGPRNLRLELKGDDGWPDEARKALASWAELGGGGSTFACFIESRTVQEQRPIARSKVIFGSTE